MTNNAIAKMNEQSIENIQALRAFAAINVALFHIIGTAASYSQSSNYLSALEGWGANGVDIFFVISGFIMLHTQMERRRSVIDFLKLRLIRIMPIYWLLTAFVIMLYLLLPNLFRELVLTPTWSLSSLFFISQLVTDKSPVIAVGWTLEFEMLFYVIFGFALLINSWKRFIICVGLTLFTTAFLFNQFFLLEFLFGLIAAYTFRQKPFSPRTGIQVFFFGIFLLSLSLIPAIRSLGLDRSIISGFPSLLIVLGAACSFQIKRSLWSYLGSASYSIYLIHALVISAFYKFSSKILSEFNGDLLAIMCLICCLTLGSLLYSFIEKPITMNLRRLVK